MKYWLNGRLCEDPFISPQDRGFTLGDGLFETVRVVSGNARHLPLHLARLRRGAAVLGIDVPAGDDAIARLIGTLCAQADAVIRITLTRGPSARGLLPVAAGVPTLLIAATPLPDQAAGAHVIVARCTRRNEHSPLSALKSLNYLDNILARREAAAQGADDALMLNTRGGIAEATAANLFVWKNGWVTPPVSEGALPGIARGLLIARLGAREAPITPTDLDDCGAAFLSNALGLREIISVGATPLPRRPLPDQP